MGCGTCFGVAYVVHGFSSMGRLNQHKCLSYLRDADLSRVLCVTTLFLKYANVKPLARHHARLEYA